MDNISGNYDTYDDEIDAVKAYLKREKIPYLDIYKYPDANAGDVMVKFPNNFYSLFEVKQESQKRFMSQYGEYGIDFISSLIFKKDIDKNKWKKIHKPYEYNDFINSLDIYNKHFKWGKIYYSYSDIWLFYVQDKDTKKYIHLEAYSAKKMDSVNLFTYLKNNCEFAVNLKSEEQLSNTDKYDSATFYIKPEQLSIMKATKEDIFHNSNIELCSDIKNIEINCLSEEILVNDVLDKIKVEIENSKNSNNNSNTKISKEAVNEDYTCPYCNTKLVLKKKNNTEFWACPNYYNGCTGFTKVKNK